MICIIFLNICVLHFKFWSFWKLAACLLFLCWISGIYPISTSFNGNLVRAKWVFVSRCVCVLRLCSRCFNWLKITNINAPITFHFLYSIFFFLICGFFTWRKHFMFYRFFSTLTTRRKHTIKGWFGKQWIGIAKR